MTHSNIPARAPVEAAEITMAGALRLALLTDIHKARRDHRPTGNLVDRLRRVTAQIAAAQARNLRARECAT